MPRHIKPSYDCRNPKNFSDTAAGDRISEEKIVDSQIFSWGYVSHQVTRSYTLGQLVKDIYGGAVFSKIP